MIPSSCAAATAAATASMVSAACSSGSRPRHSMKLARSSPSRSSITRNVCPPSLPTSVTSTACGCRTRDVSCASRKNRARASRFSARAGLMTLIATFLPIARWTAS